MDPYEGWAPDPFESHELRYFVDGRPTKLVRDGSVETFDDLPLRSSLAASGTTDQPVPDPQVYLWDQPTVETASEPVDQPTLESVFEHLDQPLVETASEPVDQPTLESVFEHLDQPPVAPVFEPAPEPVIEPVFEPVFEPADQPMVREAETLPTVNAVQETVQPLSEPLVEMAGELGPDPSSPPPPPAGTSYWAPPPPPSVGVGESAAGAPRSSGLGFTDTFAVGSEPGRTRRPKKRLVTGLVALMVAVAAGGFIAVASGSKNAAAAVINSVNTSMAVGSAQITMNLAVHAGGMAVTGTGTGSIDFAQNAMQLQMSVGVGAQQVQTQTLYIAGAVYEQIPGLAQVVPGKSWLSVDLSSLGASAGQSPSTLATGDNPTAMLRILAQQGNTVVPLGSSTLDGTTVQGYSVTLDPTAIKNKIAQDKLPSWMTDALSHVNIGDVDLDVYVDGTGLLRRFSLSLSETVPTAGAIRVDESLDFSDYGTTVTVSAPPPDQVVSLQQFLAQAQASGASSS